MAVDACEVGQPGHPPGGGRYAEIGAGSGEGLEPSGPGIVTG
ncbi:hypothetical protein [Streptomyces arboris]|nr:hypothetical protein [Streptomyces arboris]